MIRKDDLLAALLHECHIASHLYTKVPEGAWDYRPGPTQRTTLELLQYLQGCGIGSARAMSEGSWDGYKAAMERAADMKPDAFPALMEKQKAELEAFFEGLDDAALETQEATLPWGEKVTLGRALLETTLKWMTAYRMQLFLYAKASGNDAINTANNWGGVDYEGDDL